MLAQAQAEADEERGALAGKEAVARASEARLAQARAGLRRAEETVAAIEQAMARREASARLGRLQDQLARGEEAEAKRREAAAAAGAIGMSREAVAELEELGKSADRAKAQLDAASVRIGLEPEGARAVTVDGRPHEGELSLRLSRDSELWLEGFGKVTVRPGGGVPDLARRAAATAAALDSRLREHAVADVAHARAELQRRIDGQRTAEDLRKLVETIAPQGLDALRQEIESRRALLARPVSAAAAACAEATAAILDDGPAREGRRRGPRGGGRQRRQAGRSRPRRGGPQARDRGGARGGSQDQP